VGREMGSEQRKFRSEQWSGPLNPKYDGGNYSVKKRVFERDNYVCQRCGLNDRRVLVMDHIKNKAIYPELRYDMDNCITLCANCHMIKTKEDKELKQWRSTMLKKPTLSVPDVV
jgi:hypothetical protein